MDNHDHKSRVCHWSDCEAEALYPAPCSPDRLEKKLFFCLEHIRIYNQNWDFFSQFSGDEIDQFRVDALRGHRPLWSKENPLYQQLLRDKIAAQGAKAQEAFAKIDVQEQQAFKTLELHEVVGWKEIRKRYKALAKKHHPDINKEHNEEALKSINSAYAYLKRKYEE